MDWYHVIKTIKGKRYHYWQKTFREGGRVRTINRYIGPVDGPAMSLPDVPPKPPKPIPDWAAPNSETKIETFVEARELQELELEISIMGDALAEHPGRALAKRYNLARYRTGNSLAQLNVSAAGKGTASTRLDSNITELGFNSLDEADEAIESFNEATKRLQSLKMTLRELRAAAKIIPDDAETKVLDQDGLPAGGDP